MTRCHHYLPPLPRSKHETEGLFNFRTTPPPCHHHLPPLPRSKHKTEGLLCNVTMPPLSTTPPLLKTQNGRAFLFSYDTTTPTHPLPHSKHETRPLFLLTMFLGTATVNNDYCVPSMTNHGDLAEKKQVSSFFLLITFYFH